MIVKISAKWIIITLFFILESILVVIYNFHDLGDHPKAANEGHLKSGQRS